MADWVVEPLGKQHLRGTFNCGVPSLDDFLLHRVGQYEKRRIGKTFVAVARGDVTVIGYYTLAAGSIQFDHLPSDTARRLPRHPIPTVLLARLAVDLKMHGLGIGEYLLMDALERSLKLSRDLAVFAVEVKAIDQLAANFYRKYGFYSTPAIPLHLFLPLSDIEHLFD